MKKQWMVVLLAILLKGLMPCKAQEEHKLWQKYHQAVKEDLPRKQMAILDELIVKTYQKHVYDELLRARLLRMQVAYRISPDSVPLAIDALKKMAWESLKHDNVASAVSFVSIGKAYENYMSLESAPDSARHYYALAMKNPLSLFKAKTKKMRAVLIDGQDSKTFGHDMLHVIGYETGDFDAMCRTYESLGQRAAACISALEKIRHQQDRDTREWHHSRLVASLDSLYDKYQDLPESGEIVLEQYSCMEEASDVSAAEKVNFIKKSLARHRSYARIGLLRSKYLDLTSPMLDMMLDKDMIDSHASTSLKINLLRNVGQIKIELYKTPYLGDVDEEVMRKAGYRDLLKQCQRLDQYTRIKKYQPEPEYQIRQDSVVLPMLDRGVYLLQVTTDKDIKPFRKLIFVSDLIVVQEAYQESHSVFRVVDARTGNSIPQANMILKISNYRNQKKEVKRYKTDDKGEVKIGLVPRCRYELYASTEQDKCFKATAVHANYFYRHELDVRLKLRIFTDRAIYRPGQQVFATSIVYALKNNVHAVVVADSLISFKLYDASGRELGQQSQNADKMGQATVQFRLPENAISGYYTLEASLGRQSLERMGFMVEAYKRPHFKVSFLPVQKAYAAGDTIIVKAKAMTNNGLPLVGAQTRYRVTRECFDWWRICGSEESTKEILQGETVTDSMGHFNVKVPLTLPTTADKRDGYSYHFSVTADVTDATGESQSGMLILPLSSRSQMFHLEGDTLIERGKKYSLRFICLNALGEPLNLSVSFKVKGYDKTYSTQTNQEFVLDVSCLKSGCHTIEAVCGKDTIRHNLTVFDLQDNKPSIQTPDWFYVSSDQFENQTKPVYVQLGDGNGDLYVSYTLLSDDKIILRKQLHLRDTLALLTFRYRDEYKDGITVAVNWVKDGAFYNHTVQIKRPLPPSQLQVKWHTFRDRLTPGAEENWIAEIKNPDGSPASAQLMLTIYDKALDALSPHLWQLDMTPQLDIPSFFADRVGSFRDINFYGMSSFKPTHIRNWSITHLDPMLFSLDLPLRRGQDVNLYAASLKEMAVLADDVKKSDSNQGLKSEGANHRQMKSVSDAQKSSEGGKGGGSMPTLRQNFDETAYYAPCLQTDKHGKVYIRFTLPQSVTGWQIMGLAHDKEMRVGTLLAEAKAVKSLMVTPYLPRFMRMGDEVTINAKVQNLSPDSQHGVASLEICDAKNGNRLLESKQNIKLLSGESPTISFKFKVDAAIFARIESSVICRISVVTDKASDGEQHYLDLLSQEEKVTKTLPFVMHVAGKKDFALTPLYSKPGQSGTLTLEYMPDPRLMIMQALPYFETYDTHNAIDLAANLFASRVTCHLLENHPEYKEKIMKWHFNLPQQIKRKHDKDLQKTEDNLKPWYKECKTEEERISMLRTYLETAANNYAIQEKVLQLLNGQDASGAWSWYPGMEGNLYITMSVLEMLLKADRMVGQLPDLQTSIAKAMNFFGKEIKTQVREMRNKKITLHQSGMSTSTYVKYLYLCAMTYEQQSHDLAAEKTYLLEELDKYSSTLNIHDKALLAIVLHKRGNVEKAKQYMQSLLEYSVFDAVKGRYYDSPRATSDWQDYRIPTQVAVLQALKMIRPTAQQTINEFKQWLLTAKQTQLWSTSINSVEAVYAFMGDDEKQNLGVEKNDIKIKINDTPMHITRDQLFDNYVKSTIEGANLKQLTIQKNDNQTSWGAVYLTQWVKADELSSTQAKDNTGLVIVRECVMPDNPKPGDKVKVKIKITADRDYDFVEVLDNIPACLEPLIQQSGYQGRYYYMHRDTRTAYFYDHLPKGEHLIETTYHITRKGIYAAGTCTVQCTYSPEYQATTKGYLIHIRQ